jgi:heme/copper-type cytochrome/quinol oxidase subunit 2
MASRVKTVAVALSTRITRTAFALFMVGIMGYVVYQAKFGFGAFEPRAAIFPWVIGLPMLAMAIFIFVQESLRSTKEIRLGQFSFERETEVPPSVERQRTIEITCWIIGFFLAIWILGFVPASAIATLLYLKIAAQERWPVTLAISAASWLFFFGLFDYALQLPFPTGVLFDWLPVKVADLPWDVFS